MLLVDLIEANPQDQVHPVPRRLPLGRRDGRHPDAARPHVWLDSVWLPTFSYSTAKRAFHEWLEVMPSNRIMWGADANHAEGIYGATEMTRRCLAEVLAEKVDRGDLREEHALRIGRQILRDNALALFPQLENDSGSTRWAHTGFKPRSHLDARSMEGVCRAGAKTHHPRRNTDHHLHIRRDDGRVAQD